jgi:hypothetical protein
MTQARATRSTLLLTLKMALRFGLPLIGLTVFGHAVLLSVGGDIEHWQFALGVLLILAGFVSKLVPRA